ncbi:OFA family MFS transporter [Streptomyces sp. NPDC057616]|uniref:OFA family MFS transporter n=1 Tax=Streptomyces sp. NPDC057616 TaxID=3346183 RepID=UPI0036BD33DF
MTTTHYPSVPCREVTDRKGRVYRVGESDVDLMSRTRTSMVVLSWLGMTGISSAELAFASAGGALHEAHAWSGGHIFRLLGVWVFFQAATAYPAGLLRESGRLPARAATACGAAGALLGFLWQAFVPDAAVAQAGFGVLGGIGAGLVQATCLNTAGKWYPERKGFRTGLVSAGPALGSVPFAVLVASGLDLGGHPAVLAAVGTGLCLVVAAAGRSLVDPPKNWWPADVDPLRMTGEAKTRRALLKNPPAVRQYTVREAVRTPVLWMMWLCLLCTAGVAVHGVAVLVPFGHRSGFADGSVATALALTAVAYGTGSAVAGWVSDRWGRRTTLIGVCIVLGTAQFGVLVSGQAGSAPLLLLCSAVSGLGGGAVLPLFAAMTADHFGENHNATIHGLLHGSALIAGLAASGVAALVAGAWDYHGAFVLAGSVGLASAVPALFLKSPGRPNARRIVPNPHPLGEEMSLT